MASRACFHRLKLVGLVLVVSCAKTPPPPPPAPTVRVAPVALRSVEETGEWLATLDGSVNADIRPQVQGYVDSVPYHEGTVVAAGTLLFTIDRRPLVAAVETARGNYQSLVAQLGKARRDVARYTPLAAMHAISQQTLDDARAALRAGEASVHAAAGALAAARLNLSFAAVRSPIAGLAGIAQVRVGSLVSANSVLTTVSTVDPIRASISISQRDYLRFAEVLNHVNEPRYSARRYLQLVLADGEVYPARARRVIVNRQIDPTTGTLLIQALFPNPQNLLRPGLFAKVLVHSGFERQVLVVPERAVGQVQGTYHVALIGRGQRVEIRQIKVGPVVGHEYVVTAGLRAGEAVVVEGIDRARPGSKVEVQPSELPDLGG